jgi:hypothetical protein
MGTTRSTADGTPFRYCGRTFTEAEIETIRRITDDPWHTTRTDIIRAVCQALNWVKPDGQPKLASCGLALQRMEAHGVIWLPLPTRQRAAFKPPAFTQASDPGPLITGTRGDLRDLHLVPVSAPAEAKLWNELMARYHYLGGRPMIGAQVRYLAYDGERILAAMGFGAAAWALAPRDRFIGWTAAEREAKLHLVVQLRRLLILPWLHVKNLASSLLAMAAHRLPEDWQRRAAYRPVLIESFVERARFRGTAYAAANWIRVGQTRGRGKLDRYNQGGKPVKDIWLFPLDPRFRAVLTDGRLSPAGRRVPQ